MIQRGLYSSRGCFRFPVVNIIVTSQQTQRSYARGAQELSVTQEGQGRGVCSQLRLRLRLRLRDMMEKQLFHFVSSDAV